METKEMPCLVCGDQVRVSANIPEDEAVLCMVHFFTEDLSETWEEGDGTVED